MCSCDASTSSLRKTRPGAIIFSGGPEFFKRAHLHRRGVRAQQTAVFQPERVLHVARGMIGGDVERVEVVVLGFDLGAVEYGESQGDEQIFEFLLDLRDRMQSCRGGCRARAW